MKFLRMLLRAQSRQSYARAHAYERTRRIPDRPSSLDTYRAVARRLAQPPAVLFGALPDGLTVEIPYQIALRSALVLGATGSGKSRLLIHLLLALLSETWRASEPSLSPAPEIELCDPKRETFDLLSRYVAALWLRADDEARERLACAIRVIDWSKDAVAPFAPFDNPGDVSDSFLAYLRADVAVQASAQSYSESLKTILFMFNRVLVDRRFPPNFRFASRFFNDSVYRLRILESVTDPDVRAYYSDLEHIPRQTREALLRRIQSDLAFPEIKLSMGIPPDDLRKILPKSDPTIVLGNYGATMSLPLSKAKERASYRLIDVLLAAPRRNSRRPSVLLIEESPMLLSGSTELAQPLCEAARTLRAVGVGLWFSGQDVANALPLTLVRTLQLNTVWNAYFQTREEADWLYPHILPNAADTNGERDRHRSFLRHMHGLPRRHFYLLAKGEPALPLRAPEIEDPERQAQVPADELRDVFRREIASRSLVPAGTACELIAKWEASVVDQAVLPAPPPPRNRKSAGSLAELVRQLEYRPDEDG
jgi:hypothetical protein